MDEAWLNTVRLARDLGDISSLFPKGITRLVDLPHTLHAAIRMAMFFVSFEKLPRDEQPPRQIWLDKRKMDEWWKAVEQRREEKYNPNKVDTSDMPENAMLKELIVGGNFG